MPALNDKAPVVQWLDPDDSHRHERRTRVPICRARSGVEVSLSNHRRGADRSAPNELDDQLAVSLVVTLELPRKALLAVGRVEDEAKLATSVSRTDRYEKLHIALVASIK